MKPTMHAIAFDNGCSCNSGAGCDELDQYDDEDLAKTEIAECWYTYRTGSYCGCGQLIGVTTDGKWVAHDMGHCSCYGPLDGIAKSCREAFVSVDALLGNMSEEARSQYAHLAAAAAEVRP